MCSSRKYPYPPPPFSRRATEGRGTKGGNFRGGWGLLTEDFSADLSEIVELLINNSSSVEQTFSYFTATGIHRFHCHATKKIINWKPSSGRSQENLNFIKD